MSKFNKVQQSHSFEGSRVERMNPKHTLPHTRWIRACRWRFKQQTEIK